MNPSYYTDSTFFHHCPSCRCSPSHNPSNNTYYSPSSTIDQMAMTFNPLNTFMLPPRSNVFAQTAPTRDGFNRSLNKCQVTFAYTSPILVKPNHSSSSSSRFSTKKYKQRKFPHFGSKDKKEAPILQILKKKEKENNSPDIRKKANTPQKPKLKMNKVKSQKLLELQSRKSSSSLNIFSQKGSQQQLPSQHNEEDNKQQVYTPVGQLKENREPTVSPRPVPPEQDYTPMIKNKKSQKKIGNTKGLGLIEICNSSKYPTLKSIEIFQPLTSQQQNFINQGKSQTSLRVQHPKQSQLKKQGLIQASDREIASNLSQQLDLNYDYFFLMQQSDRSLSQDVSL